MRAKVITSAHGLLLELEEEAGTLCSGCSIVGGPLFNSCAPLGRPAFVITDKLPSVYTCEGTNCLRPAFSYSPSFLLNLATDLSSLSLASIEPCPGLDGHILSKSSLPSPSCISFVELASCSSRQQISNATENSHGALIPVCQAGPFWPLSPQEDQEVAASLPG